tara:strand:- start:3660 stop:5276 length:1617 start_codon:yes stop_codon:yes gene_type:complete
MANGFTFESPLNRLLDVTIPRFLESQLARQEREQVRDQARQDRMDDIERQQQNMLRQEQIAEDRFNMQMMEQDKQNSFVRQQAFKQEQERDEARIEEKKRYLNSISRDDDRILYEELSSGNNLQSIVDMAEKDEDGNIILSTNFNTPAYNQRYATLARKAQSEINSNKTFVNSLKFDPDLQSFFKKQVNTKGMQEGSNELVFNYLQQKLSRQDAQKARSLANLINIYGAEQTRLKNLRDNYQQLLTIGGSKEDQQNTISQIESVEDNVNNLYSRLQIFIQNTPSYDTNIDVEEESGDDIVTSANFGRTPETATPIKKGENIGETIPVGGFISRTNPETNINEIFFKNDEGKFEQYRVPPEASDRPDLTAIQRLAGTSPTPTGIPARNVRDFLRTAPRIEQQFGTGEGGVLTLGGSPKEQVQAVKVVEDNSDVAIKDLTKSRRLAVAGRESEEEYQEKRNLKNLELQNLISNSYEAYLNEGTSPRVKARLKKFLQKMKDTQKKPMFTGTPAPGFEPFRITGGRNIFNEDTVDLLNQIEL